MSHVCKGMSTFNMFLGFLKLSKQSFTDVVSSS